MHATWCELHGLHAVDDGLDHPGEWPSTSMSESHHHRPPQTMPGNHANRSSVKWIREKTYWQQCELWHIAKGTVLLSTNITGFKVRCIYAWLHGLRTSPGAYQGGATVCHLPLGGVDVEFCNFALHMGTPMQLAFLVSRVILNVNKMWLWKGPCKKLQ